MKITQSLRVLLDQWHDLTDRPYLTMDGLGPGIRPVKAMCEYLATIGPYDPTISTNQNIINILGQEAHDLRKKIEREIKAA